MKKYKTQLIIIALVPLTILIDIIFKFNPTFVENFYIPYIYKLFTMLLSNITSIIPISLAEIFYFPVIIFFLIYFIKIMLSIRKKGFLKKLLNFLATISIVFVIFMTFWHYCYHRDPLEKILNVTIEESSKQDLYNLCVDLINKTNALREPVKENSDGIMILNDNTKSMLKRAKHGYNEYIREMPELKGIYGDPKGVMASKFMNYTGITGMYCPFSGEANVDIAIPDFSVPETTLHEMAHQRGFAKEEEANYIAYLVSTKHPDKDFKYSGSLSAMRYAMNAMYSTDENMYKELIKLYSPKVKKDLIYNREFWVKYEGPTEKIYDKINDTYLKANGTPDGVQSYGRMVDLLLAQYKKDSKK